MEGHLTTAFSRRRRRRGIGPKARASIGWAAALVALALPAVGLAQAGSLDPTFSGDGKATVNFSPRFDWVNAVVVQADGKIVTAGASSGGTGMFALARQDPDGALDPSFSGDGRVTTNLSGGFDQVEGVVLLPDERIIVVGSAAVADGRMALARYETDGDLDPTFSGDGKVLTNLTPGRDFATGVALQADGKIVVTGGAGGLGGRVALARYNANGSLDSTFSGDGKVITNFTPRRDYATSVELQTAGEIVVAGTADFNGQAARFALARYEADGTLDPAFGGDGKVTTNLTSGLDRAFGLAVQPADEMIVAVGWAGHRMGLVRYEPAGDLDPTFSGDGKVLTNFTAGVDYASGVEVQADGRIVIAGPANWTGRDTRFGLARYTTAGDLDPTFSGDGKATTNFTPGSDPAFALTLQPADGKIVVAGGARGQGARFAIARYLGS
jgi:uncharacterized delta-60 repeat protein